jgi:hypothetical protein
VIARCFVVGHCLPSKRCVVCCEGNHLFHHFGDRSCQLALHLGDRSGYLLKPSRPYRLRGIAITS